MTKDQKRKIREQYRIKRWFSIKEIEKISDDKLRIEIKGMKPFVLLLPLFIILNFILLIWKGLVDFATEIPDMFRDAKKFLFEKERKIVTIPIENEEN